MRTFCNSTEAPSLFSPLTTFPPRAPDFRLGSPVSLPSALDPLVAVSVTTLSAKPCREADCYGKGTEAAIGPAFAFFALSFQRHHLYRAGIRIGGFDVIGNHQSSR